MFPDPILVRIGPLQVHWYGVFMAAAFLGGLANWVWLGRRTGKKLNDCADLLFWIMIAGIVGARIAYVLSDLPSFIKAPLTIFRVDQGGLVYYGGMLAATGALAVFARRHKEPFLRLGDLAVTSLPLGHALGRLGCFVNGCCYGRPYAGILSVTYPPQSAPWWGQVYEQIITRYAPRSLPVHPVQLYETAFNLVLYAGLVVLYRRGRTDGRVVAAYLLLYPAWRFLAETLRGDERPHWCGLSIGQWLSTGLIIGGFALLVYLRNRRHASD